MTVRRPVLTVIALVVPLSLFVGFGAGVCVPRWFSHDPTGDQTDLGRHVIAELDTQTDWHPTGRQRDGMRRHGGLEYGPSPLIIWRDTEANGTVGSRRHHVRVILAQLDVTDQLSLADQELISAALDRRRAAYAAAAAARQMASSSNPGAGSNGSK